MGRGGLGSGPEHSAVCCMRPRLGTVCTAHPAASNVSEGHSLGQPGLNKLCKVYQKLEFSFTQMSVLTLAKNQRLHYKIEVNKMVVGIGIVALVQHRQFFFFRNVEDFL